MPMGLCNAPSIFQGVTDALIKGLLNILFESLIAEGSIIMYMDDNLRLGLKRSCRLISRSSTG